MTTDTRALGKQFEAYFMKITGADNVTVTERPDAEGYRISFDFYTKDNTKLFDQMQAVAASIEAIEKNKKSLEALKLLKEILKS